MQQFIFETIIFINHLPCYYRVYHLSGYYLYEPIPHHFYESVIFPDLVLNQSNGTWNVIGINDQNMIAPLIRELEEHIIPKSTQQQ